MSDHIHDLIGIGFGPSNLALAVALHERKSPLDRIFLEAQPGFAWRPGMMIEGADMQVSFLKDLVSLRDPTSGFSFLSYLHDKGRLERFINRKTFFPSRVEYNDYLAWAAGRLEGVCVYDQRVTLVEPVRRGDAVTHLRIHSRDAAGRTSQRLARQIVLAPGGRPHWPQPFDALRGDAAISHSADFVGSVLPGVRTGQRIAVIGGGQSATEIFVALARHAAAPAVDLIQRGHALKPADDSPFVNEIFRADRTGLLHEMDPKHRAAFIHSFAPTNYGVTDLDLLQSLYGLLYDQEVQGGERLQLWRDTSVKDAHRLPGGGIGLVLDYPAGRQQLHCDHVVLATGYRRVLSKTVLAGLSDWIADEQPDRLYRLPMRPGFDPAIHVQGYSEATHGLSDTLLSLLAIRAQEIAASLDDIGVRRPVAAE